MAVWQSGWLKVKTHFKKSCCHWLWKVPKKMIQFHVYTCIWRPKFKQIKLTKVLAAVGLEPTPFRTGAWNRRLRPLGHATTTQHLWEPSRVDPGMSQSVTLRVREGPGKSRRRPICQPQKWYHFKGYQQLNLLDIFQVLFYVRFYRLVGILKMIVDGILTKCENCNCTV